MKQRPGGAGTRDSGGTCDPCRRPVPDPVGSTVDPRVGSRWIPTRAQSGRCDRRASLRRRSGRIQEFHFGLLLLNPFSKRVRKRAIGFRLRERKWKLGLVCFKGKRVFVLFRFD